ncbi:CHAT domain-containing protein [Nannocystis pusilla]|uniref:CHAT domain-containing protein n=1 Tax=Nannocystis pusilla TaxID=889268 RepID=A0A9X3ETE3_9BACT|nr:CHAT domain-containing protein [Nannocystis pusilla]
MAVTRDSERVETLYIRIGRGFAVESRLEGRELPAGALDPAALAAVAEVGPDEQGARLFAALDAPAREAWRLAAALAPRRRIRLRIDDDAPELHALPWEALRDTSAAATARVPAADRDTPFSRQVPWSWALPGPVAARPLRVLGAVAAPAGLDAYGLPPIDRPGEEACLAEAMAAAPAGLVEPTALAGHCSLVALEAALEGGYDVLHLVAHGVLRDGELALFLEREGGGVERVAGASFAAMLERLDRRPRLVVLMVCSSATRSVDDPRRGLAPAVLAAGVPAVLAMQDLMPIDTGRAFTRALYGELWAGGEVDRAANRARATLLTGGLRGSAVPVLYSALADNRLFTPRAPASAGGSDEPALSSALADEQLSTPRAGGSDEPNVYSALADDRLSTPRAGGSDEPGRDARRGLSIPRNDLAAGDDPARGAPRGLSTPRSEPDRGAWQALGGPFHGVCAARGRDGRVELFAIDAAAAQLHVRRQQQPGGPWGAWEAAQPGVVDACAAVDERGVVSLFTVGPRGEVTWRERHDAGGWAGRQPLAGEATQLAVACGLRGAFTALAVDSGGLLQSCAQRQAGGAWDEWEGDWEDDDEQHLQIGLARDGRGLLSVFTLRTDHSLWQSSQDARGEYRDWRRLATELRRVHVLANAGGRLRLTAIGEDGALLHRVEREPGGPWGPWQRIVGAYRDAIAAPRQADVALLAIDGEGAACCLTGAGARVALGGPALVRLVAAEDGAGALHVFGLDPTGTLHHRPLP